MAPSDGLAHQTTRPDAFDTGPWTPRGVRDRPDVKSAGDRADSPKARRLASYPDIASNPVQSFLPRTQAVCFVASYTRQTPAPGEMFAPVCRILESPITVTWSSSSRSQASADDGPRDVRGKHEMVHGVAEPGGDPGDRNLRPVHPRDAPLRDQPPRSQGP
jgi:hypothetical protein